MLGHHVIEFGKEFPKFDLPGFTNRRNSSELVRLWAKFLAAYNLIVTLPNRLEPWVVSYSHT